MMVGTVSYMPPEQAMGGEVTPQSDLYSLGAMLYEMVTGRPPFLGDDSVAIIGQHINTPPVAPTWHNSACPRPMEALILRLLAKDPSERPGSASDVLAALDGMDLTATSEASVEDAQPLDSLAGGVFVGRQREMGELKACLEDALSGRGRLVTLVGEPGIGKTRTAQELATYAGLRSAQVLWGRCYEEQGMPPYWPWVQAIRSYVRERDPEQLRSEMGAGAADIAEIVSDVKDRLPDLRPPPQLESPEQARFRLFDSITSFLKSASQKQPLVLVLDDLHWADQPSLLLLQFVARELSGARLLLVGTYRDMELSRQHPLAETLGELTRERLFQRVLLRGLSQQDVARFIEVAAGVDPPSGLAEAVHTQTEGNPLFVTEVVRLLVQEGELTQESEARDSWTVRIPEGVREVIGRRLNRLSQRCNETLTIASVIGREFELRQLAPLVDDMSEDRLLEVLEEALAARVIEELPQAVGRYQFTHALIRETLIQELSATRRTRLHARIAEALEQLYESNVEAHAAELAHHFAEAETILGTERLVQYSLLAGEQALAAYAYEEALSHFQRGLEAKEVPLEGNDPARDAEVAALLYGLGR
ncbi:MAG: AAA family ATPase, partial [Dehalococcoidia bacterium]